MPNVLNDAFLNNASHLTSDDENDKLINTKIKTISEQLHSYSLTNKSKAEYNKKKD